MTLSAPGCIYQDEATKIMRSNLALYYPIKVTIALDFHRKDLKTFYGSFPDVYLVGCNGFKRHFNS